MCGSGKGGSSSSSSTNSTTPPAYLNSAYQNLVSNAQSTASTPYSAYSGQLVAPMNGTQNQAINQVMGAQGIENPYLNMATNAVSTSQTNPWSTTQQYSPSAIQSYYNPYQTDVVNATMANIDDTNAQQQTQLQGNAISSGAWGGDRAGIAASELAKQQGLAANQTLAQLQNQGYTQAQGEFNTQQASQLGANEATGWLNSQAGNTYNNIGTSALNNSLAGSNALLSAGNLQQTNQQAQDTSGYNQYLQQLAFPYQQESWLSSILNGTGSVAGGTTAGSGTTTQGGPSGTSQVLGLGMGVLGAAGSAGSFSSLFSNRGGRIPYRHGGIVGKPHFASGGPTDFLTDVSIGWIPSPTAKGGHANFPGEYRAPSVQNNGNGGRGGSGGIAAASKGLGSLFGSSGTNFSGGIDPLTGNSAATQSGINMDFVGNGSGVSDLSGGAQTTPFISSDMSGFMGGSTPSSGIDFGNMLSAVGSNRGGRIPRASGGGIFSSLSAAHHMAPHIALMKQQDLLKTPKFGRGGIAGKQHFQIGGEVLPIVGDIAGAFFGDPMAGNQFEGISKMLGLSRGGRAHYDDGGAIGGMTPTSASADPMTQGMYQRYAGLSAEKLQELAVRYPPSTPQGSLIHRALSQKQTMPAQQQSAAQPQQAATGLQTPAAIAPQGFADGGGLGADDIDQYVTADNGNSVPLSSLQSPDAPQDVPHGTVTAPMGGIAAGDTPNTVKGFTPTSTPMTSKEKLESRFEDKPDPWQALMEAGFATMAGTSRSALTNIGEGALAGMKNYSGQKQQINDRAYKEAEVDDAADKLSQEADYHKDNLNLEQKKLDSQSAYQQGELGLKGQELKQQGIYQQAQIRNMQQERLKPISDGMGGFMQLDPDSGKYIPLGGGGGDATIRSINNLYNIPKDQNGVALTGDALLNTIPAPIAQQAKSYLLGNSAPPTGFATKPNLLAAYQAAQAADPNFEEHAGTRYKTIQDFANPNGKVNQTLKSQNVTMEHIATLHDAVDALNNGDMKAWNYAVNTIADQIGKPAPNNFELGRELVSDEIAKAVLGSAGAVADRKAIKDALSPNASHAQAYGALDQAGKYMAGQAYGIEQSYVAGTGLQNYRDRFATPAAKALMDKYYPGGKPASQQADNSQILSSAPPLDKRVVGQTYQTPKGAMTWQGTGWLPSRAGQ